VTEPLVRPKRKNPLRRTRQPLSPQGVRSRTAHGLTAAAAEGRFALQVCLDCGAVIYPPRDACPSCLSPRLPFRDVDRGGTLLAETTVQTSTDPYFRERTPWRVGSVKLDAGPVVVAHLHGDTVEGGRVRLDFKLDKSGSAVAIALPEKDTPNMADDPHLREMTCDPKFRRVLITDGRNAVGQAMAKAFSDAGASIVFVGLADACRAAGRFIRSEYRELAGVFVVVLGLVGWRQLGASTLECDDAGDRIAATWSPERRQVLTAAFSGFRGGPEAVERVSHALSPEDYMAVGRDIENSVLARAVREPHATERACEVSIRLARVESA